jgi:hypothetical protein
LIIMIFILLKIIYSIITENKLSIELEGNNFICILAVKLLFNGYC